MRIGLVFKYDREVVNGSENREIPDLWGRVDRYGSRLKVFLFLALAAILFNGAEQFEQFWYTVLF